MNSRAMMFKRIFIALGIFSFVSFLVSFNAYAQLTEGDSPVAEDIQNPSLLEGMGENEDEDALLKNQHPGVVTDSTQQQTTLQGEVLGENLGELAGETTENTTENTTEKTENEIVEMDPNKELIELPKEELDKLQEEIAKIDDPTLKQEMLGVIANDIQLAVIENPNQETNPQNIPGNISGQQFNGDMFSSGGQNPGLQQMDGTIGPMPGGVPGGDMAQRRPGFEMVSFKEFFTGVQVETMGLAMMEKGGFSPQQIDQFTDMSKGMIAQGGNPMEVFKDAFQQIMGGPNGPNMEGPMGHMATGGPMPEMMGQMGQGGQMPQGQEGMMMAQGGPNGPQGPMGPGGPEMMFGPQGGFDFNQFMEQMGNAEFFIAMGGPEFMGPQGPQGPGGFEHGGPFPGGPQGPGPFGPEVFGPGGPYPGGPEFIGQPGTLEGFQPPPGFEPPPGYEPPPERGPVPIPPHSHEPGTPSPHEHHPGGVVHTPGDEHPCDPACVPGP